MFCVFIRLLIVPHKMTVDNGKTEKHGPLAFNIFENSQLPRLIMKTAGIFFRVFVPEITSNGEIYKKNWSLKKIF